MSEFLIVRLSNNTNAAIQWLVWAEQQKEVIASGELASWEHLSDLTDYADNRRTIVLLSTASIVLTEVEIPAGGSRQFEAMLPFIVEDELAQDVEQLHFTILGKQAGHAQVCAVEKSWLKQILHGLAEAGCQVQKVMPDVLALPTQEGISAVELDDMWLLKKGPHQGLAIHSDWLGMVAQSDWVKQQDDYLPLTAYSTLPELTLADGQEWHNGEPTLVMQMLAQEAVGSKITLLTGEFKAKSSLVRYWKVWQKVAVAAVVLMAVVMVDNLLQIQRYEAQAAAYRAESERIFRQSLPGKNKIPTVSYLKREMDREAKRLSGGSVDESILTWMTGFPALLKQVPGLTLTSFKFDGARKEVRIQAQSKDFQTFEKARELFASKYQVEQGQLNRSGTLVNGSYVLKPL
ncbi:general secretion pathway protein GspL [Vibrio variabilis]|uniref:Type II secretion system protein L n=1 Tax=Vibrio variabilis TaxID=990271 RepID=A0ABR4YEP8_9VIBR|nr:MULTISPECIES: type II secretion system protein GspL [Vibrio]KHA61746.1 general secretion pathway protein GspL [Vibrio variabilis]KHT43095.1 general secretion pathway protein GspL [Vibrio sinaloensis]